jgi:hypothetical protein
MAAIMIVVLAVYWLYKPSLEERARKKRIQKEREDKLPRVPRVNGKKVL